MILRSRTEPGDTDRSAQPTTAHSFSRLFACVDPPHPAEWLAAARLCPTLARAIAQSHSQESLDRSTCDWTRAFIHGPHWLALADQLRNATASLKTVDLTLAELARSIAAQTNWLPADLAYWRALTQETQDRPIQQPLRELRGVDRCVEAARRLMEGSTNGLELEFPNIDWFSLKLEAKNAKTSPAIAFDESDFCRLELIARAAHWRDESRRCELTAKISSAAAWEDAVRAALELALAITGEPCAVWLVESNSDPSGAGAFATEASSVKCFLDEPLSSFQERRLPTNYRASRDLIDDQFGRVGRVYACEDQTLQRAQLHWTAMTAAVASIHRREIAGAAANTDAESEDRFQQRLREAIAEFSAGAGHEINNPLAAISGQVQWLLTEEVEPDRRRVMTKIHEQVDRVHRMIRDLHLIGRRIVPRREPTSLADVLIEAVAQAAKRRPTVNLTIQPSASDLEVIGASKDLARLISELIVNGVEAAGPEGRVEVQVEELADPAWLAIRVLDSGPGFTEETRRLSPIPYFSGRPAGRGLGMGLPVALRLVEDHGGRLDLGRGRPTTVTVYLPRHIEETGPYALPAA